MLTKEMVACIPTGPGVYFFKDKRNELLYIGKAKSLRRRVLQYTARPDRLTPKVRKVVERTHSVEYDVLGSELEALIVESRLIKERQPRYNIARKRLRSHPFIKIQRRERFSRVVVAWEIEADGSEYFGPFPGRDAAEETLSLLHQLFPMRSCEMNIRPNPQYRPCFSHHIGRCEAPCAAYVTELKYASMVDRVSDFLRGDHQRRLGELLEEREQAADRLEFERARVFQNRIGALERYAVRNRYQVNALHYDHLVGVCLSQKPRHAELFFIRSSRLHCQVRVPRIVKSEDLERVFDDVFFERGPSPELTPLDVDAMNVISQWLYANRGSQEVVRLDNLSAEARSDAALRVQEVLLARYFTTAAQGTPVYAV